MNGGLTEETKLVPLLFAILMNYLLKNWPGRIIKFVDDTTAFEIIPGSILSMVIDDISNFASIRGMKLILKKCKDIIISLSKHNHE